MIRSRWQGTWLVATRSMLEQFRSRAFKVVTGILLLVSIGAVTVPQIVGEDETTYTLATVGKVPAALAAALESAESAGDFSVEFEASDDRAAVRRAVQDGDATAGLAGNTLFTAEQTDGTFPVLVAQSVMSLETASRLVEAGLTPDEVARVQSVRPPEQVPVSAVDDEDRAGVGFAVGIILYLALTFAGNVIATTVAMEKSTRISEVLLAVLRPSQALVGTVLAVGVVTLTQLLVLSAPLAVAVQVTDAVGLPAVAAGDLALAVVWFVLGFALYAFLFAASAALVDKITEASSAVVPVMTVLIVAYVLAVTVVANDPGSLLSVVTSIFPFSAPVAMPIRWASGEVPVYQLLLAMALTAGTALLLVRLAAAMYGRALLITGRRAKLREVVGRREPRRLTGA
jgi:ABC-2 type transport system permease protein